MLVLVRVLVLCCAKLSYTTVCSGVCKSNCPAAVLRYVRGMSLGAKRIPRVWTATSLPGSELRGWAERMAAVGVGVDVRVWMWKGPGEAKLSKENERAVLLAVIGRERNGTLLDERLGEENHSGR